MSKISLDGYFHPYIHDYDTIEGMIDYGGYYGRMLPKMLPILLEELNSAGRTTISRLLQFLHNADKKEECKTMFGFANYKFTIRCPQQKLAELLELTQPYLAKGLKNLEQNGIIIQKHGLIYINPLVYNQNTTYSLENLREFNVKLTIPEDNNKKQNNKTTREKVKQEDLMNIGY